MIAILRLWQGMRLRLRRGRLMKVCLDFSSGGWGRSANNSVEYHLHEYILSLWGMPLGEMLDLEKLAKTCREKGRWFFFFSSAPANCPGMYMSRGLGCAGLLTV